MHRGAYDREFPSSRIAPMLVSSHSRAVVALAVAGAVTACVPKLQPLAGTPAPARLPAAELPAGHNKIVFRWEVEDGELSARGDGVARIAAPDSARLDLFVGGFGGTSAVLIDDSLVAPGGDMARRFVPPAPMLWAGFGRLAIPPLPDTVVRVDGAVARADIGHPVVWRVTFRGDTITRLEHVDGGRVIEWLERDGNRLVYRHAAPRRSLTLDVIRTEAVEDFDAAIWRLQ